MYVDRMVFVATVLNSVRALRHNDMDSLMSLRWPMNDSAIMNQGDDVNPDVVIMEWFILVSVCVLNLGDGFGF